MKNYIKDNYATLSPIVLYEWTNIVQNNVHVKEALLSNFSLCVENNKKKMGFSCSVNNF